MTILNDEITMKVNEMLIKIHATAMNMYGFSIRINEMLIKINEIYSNVVVSFEIPSFSGWKRLTISVSLLNPP